MIVVHPDPVAGIEAVAPQFRACPAPLGAMLLEHFHGAVTRVGVGDTAFPHRYLGEDEASDAVAAAYRSNYARLSKIKKTYDPTNMFRLNQNIRRAE